MLGRVHVSDSGLCRQVLALSRCSIEEFSRHPQLFFSLLSDDMNLSPEMELIYPPDHCLRLNKWTPYKAVLFITYS